MHGDLWIVGACLDAQVAAYKRLVEHVASEVWEVGELIRPARRKPEAVHPVLGEQGGAKAKRDREPRRRQAERFARVVRRRLICAPNRAVTELGAGHEALGGLCPVLEERDDVVARRRGEVEGREVQSILLRRDDATLVVAAKLVRVEREALGRGGATHRETRRPCDYRGSGRGRADAEYRPT